MQKALHILQQYWGHSAFRPSQKEAIEAVLNKKDTLALLPTGGGKSVCFQVPAMLEEGICIVVSPLIALMQDQVNNLKSKGIKAMALTGGVSYQDLDAALDNCIYGNYKFLYLSPERLQQELVQERIRQMNVNLIAVDEAHCISQWGHDFRPAYRKIKSIKELQPNVPLLGLTATATPKVVKDIVQQLELRSPAMICQSFYRKNLAYNVIKAEDKNYQLLRLLKGERESVIIYLRSRKATIETAAFLNKKGFTAAAFHGGLNNEEKKLRLTDWLKDTTRIMVATTAFGMGIDKPNVRQVIHLHLPESLESYFQEAGRAGRDSKAAFATIITHSTDIPVLENQFLAGVPDVKDVKLVYKKLITYFRIAFGEGENTTHDFNFAHFCQHYQLDSKKTYNSLQVLDRMGILKLSEQFFKKTELEFVIPGRALQFFLKENPKFDLVVKAVLRTYGGVLESKTSINLAVLSAKTGIEEEKVLALFQELEHQNIIQFTHSRHDAAVIFLVPREDEVTINPFSVYIREQQKNKEAKIGAVLNYIDNDQVCRSSQLLDYFGEKNKIACGRCSVCLAGEENLTRQEMNDIYKAIMTLLKKSEATSREITGVLHFPEAHILEVLRLLTDRDIICRTATNAFKIKNT